jgi:mRNA interferase MazF
MVTISQGEVWWADLSEPVGSSPGYKRPVVIVQGDPLNRSRISSTIAVALTSDAAWAAAPGNVALTAELTGLPKDLVANVSQIITLDRETLVERVGRRAGEREAAHRDMGQPAAGGKGGAGGRRKALHVTSARWEALLDQGKDPRLDLLYRSTRQAADPACVPGLPIQALQLITQDDTRDFQSSGQLDLERVPFCLAGHRTTQAESDFLVVLPRRNYHRGSPP